MIENDSACQLLDWDSQFFGFRIARVNANRLTTPLCQAIDAWSDTNAVECLYFLADADHHDTIRLAEAYDYRLQDIRITLDFSLSHYTIRAADVSVVTIRTSRAEDVSTLSAISQNAFVHSRFYADLHFAREDCSALYETWIRRSCLDGFADIVFVAERDGEPVGYISCHLNHDQSEGSIGLVGVAESARGQRIGNQLIDHALNWFHEQGMARVTVVTQGSNVKAQRLYQRQGFMTQSTQLWYHKWFEDQNQPVKTRQIGTEE